NPGGNPGVLRLAVRAVARLASADPAVHRQVVPRQPHSRIVFADLGPVARGENRLPRRRNQRPEGAEGDSPAPGLRRTQGHRRADVRLGSLPGPTPGAPQVTRKVVAQGTTTVRPEAVEVVAAGRDRRLLQGPPPGETVFGPCLP